MPIYEYECKKCSSRFEHLLKGLDDAPSACPRCGGKNIEKVFSSFSVGQGRQAPASSACAACPSAACPHRLNSN